MSKHVIYVFHLKIYFYMLHLARYFAGDTVFYFDDNRSYALESVLQVCTTEHTWGHTKTFISYLYTRQQQSTTKISKLSIRALIHENEIKIQVSYCWVLCITRKHFSVTKNGKPYDDNQQNNPHTYKSKTNYVWPMETLNEAEYAQNFQCVEPRPYYDGPIRHWSHTQYVANIRWSEAQHDERETRLHCNWLQWSNNYVITLTSLQLCTARMLGQNDRRRRPSVFTAVQWRNQFNVSDDCFSSVVATSSALLSAVAELSAFFGFRPRRFLTTGDLSGDGDRDSGLTDGRRCFPGGRPRRRGWLAVSGLSTLESEASSKFSAARRRDQRNRSHTIRSHTKRKQTRFYWWTFK